MKIALSATGNTVESHLDMRFGRAPGYIIVETETMEYEALENAAATFAGGAGIAAAQKIAEMDIKAIITGNVGPNAMNVLKAAKIEIFRGNASTIKENIELFKKGALEKILTTVAPHSGMRKMK